MVARTLDPRKILQPTILEGIMNKKMEQQLDFLNIFPEVQTEALSFSYFAAAMGAEVTVFSHSPAKEADAKAMGAHHYVSTKNEGFQAKYQKHFDLILNTVGAVS